MYIEKNYLCKFIIKDIVCIKKETLTHRNCSNFKLFQKNPALTFVVAKFIFIKCTIGVKPPRQQQIRIELLQNNQLYCNICYVGCVMQDR